MIKQLLLLLRIKIVFFICDLFFCYGFIKKKIKLSGEGIIYYKFDSLFKMILPGKAGYQLLTRWRPLLIHPSVRSVIAGRSRSETPQAVPDG